MPELNTMNSPMLRVANADIGYNQNTVLKQVCFDLAEGEIGCLLGPSGCGKSTLLRSIAGFESIISGQLILDSRTLDDTQTHMAAEQRPVSMMFQDNALFPHLSALKNVMFGLHKLPKTQAKTIAQDWLNKVNLGAKAESLPHELSGGEQQRVALARALAPTPKLVLLDEPFSSLDTDLREFLSREVRDILKTEGITALLVTHDQNEAFAMADKIGVVQNGKLQQWDTAHTIYHHPTTVGVAKFIGEGALIQAHALNDGGIQTALGIISTSKASKKEGEKLYALLRPNQIVIDAQSTSNAHIVDKRFKGTYYLYELNLNNNETVIATSQNNYTLGTEVHIKLCADSANIYTV